MPLSSFLYVFLFASYPSGIYEVISVSVSTEMLVVGGGLGGICLD